MVWPIFCSLLDKKGRTDWIVKCEKKMRLNFFLKTISWEQRNILWKLYLIRKNSKIIYGPILDEIYESTFKKDCGTNLISKTVIYRTSVKDVVFQDTFIFLQGPTLRIVYIIDLFMQFVIWTRRTNLVRQDYEFQAKIISGL